jgi:hypothetical protein
LDSYCEKCGGEAKIIACIEDQSVIDKILQYLRKRPANNTLFKSNYAIQPDHSQHQERSACRKSPPMHLTRNQIINVATHKADHGG